MIKNIQIPHNLSIKEALKIIDSNSKGAVAVVDDSSCLIRLLTDGDIRRALLQGYTLESSLSLLPCSGDPIILSEGASYQHAIEVMDQNEVQQIVVVDDMDQVVDLLHRKEINQIPLSLPHMGSSELEFVKEAFNTNWIAPLGPNVDGFENELAEYTGAKYAAALSSGTAALHLGLVLLDVSAGDIVLCSSLTFTASANPILYQNATPVFIDSEPDSWNMSPSALKNALEHYSSIGKKPKAIIVVNLYGQSADMDAITALSQKFDVPIIEDAAESLGSYYRGKSSGTFGLFGVYSFNGNKIITTSGGGVLVSDNKELIEKARFLATQARDEAPYYQHSHLGYNYRMSNVLAGIGRGQLKVLDKRVEARRNIYQQYVSELADISFLRFMGELEGYYSNRWLTTLVLDPKETKITPEYLIDELSKVNVEARRIWKPMHLQPLYKGCRFFEHGEYNVSEYLFEHGVCLPSGSSMTEQELARVCLEIRRISQL